MLLYQQGTDWEKHRLKSQQKFNDAFSKLMANLYPQNANILKAKIIRVAGDFISILHLDLYSIALEHNEREIAITISNVICKIWEQSEKRSIKIILKGFWKLLFFNHLGEKKRKKEIALMSAGMGAGGSKVLP